MQARALVVGASYISSHPQRLSCTRIITLGILLRGSESNERIVYNDCDTQDPVSHGRVITSIGFSTKTSKTKPDFSGISISSSLSYPLIVGLCMHFYRMSMLEYLGSAFVISQRRKAKLGTDGGCIISVGRPGYYSAVAPNSDMCILNISANALHGHLKRCLSPQQTFNPTSTVTPNRSFHGTGL